MHRLWFGVVALSLLAACSRSPSRSPGSSSTLEFGGIDPKQPGVSCRIGDSLDPVRGCSGGALVPSGVPISISYSHQFGPSFQLTHILCTIDGHVVYQTNALNEPAPKMGLYDGVIAAGDHELRVELRVRGHGEGVFSYLKGYQFSVRSTHAFSLGPGHPLRIEIAGYEKGGRTTPLEERPAIRYLDNPAQPTGN